MSAVYSLRIGAAIDDAEDRLNLVHEMLVRISAFEDDAIVVLPAGLVQAGSPTERDAWAESLHDTARDSSLGLVFAIDFVIDSCNECVFSSVYACEGRRRLLWPDAPGLTFSVEEARAVKFTSLRSVILLGREVFSPETRALVASQRPELVIVVGHGGPTQRWQPSLAALDELAPTLFVHQDLPRRHPLATSPPRGFGATSSSGTVQLTRYSRDAPAKVGIGLL